MQKTLSRFSARHQKYPVFIYVLESLRDREFAKSELQRPETFRLTTPRSALAEHHPQVVGIGGCRRVTPVLPPRREVQGGRTSGAGSRAPALPRRNAELQVKNVKFASSSSGSHSRIRSWSHDKPLAPRRAARIRTYVEQAPDPGYRRCGRRSPSPCSTSHAAEEERQRLVSARARTAGLPTRTPPVPDPAAASNKS